MDIEQRISHYLILFEGKELTRKQTIDKIIHIQLLEGKVCDKCASQGLIGGSGINDRHDTCHYRGCNKEMSGGDDMKVADMSVKEYGNFYNLGELRRKLRFMELDRLNLKYLNPLRNELDARLLEYGKEKLNG